MLTYTVFHPLVVEVLCVLFLDYARWLGQKQNTGNFYHKRMKDGAEHDTIAVNGPFLVEFTHQE